MVESVMAISEVEQAVAFLKKSSAKDFCNVYTGRRKIHRTPGQKFLSSFFLKKELLLFDFTQTDDAPK
jgi:hypothetical protein